MRTHIRDGSASYVVALPRKRCLVSPIILFIVSCMVGANEVGDQPKLSVSAYPEPGKIVATVDSSFIGSVPGGSSLDVAIGRPLAKQALVEKHQKVTPDGVTDVILDVRALPARQRIHIT